MDEYSLRLYQEDESTLIELALHPARQIQPIAEMIRLPKTSVYSDGKYDGQLITANTSDVRFFEVYLNGYLINSTYYPKTGRFYFNDPYYGRRIFRDSFGLCTLMVRFRTPKGTQTLVSETFEVMARTREENFSVNGMAQIVAQSHSMFLYGSRKDYQSQSFRPLPFVHSLEDRIELYRRLDALMPQLLETFSKNPLRTVASPRQSMNPSHLLEVLARHPECVTKSATPTTVRWGTSYLKMNLPQTSSLNSQSLDTWENQYVMAFLRQLGSDLDTLIVQIQDVISRIPSKYETRDEYVSTSLYMSSGIISCLRLMKSDLEELRIRWSQMLIRAKDVLPVRQVPFKALPKPTPAFLSRPGYREIYGAMVKWNELRNVGTGDLRFATTFLRITEFYEIYVLAKLGRYFEQAGFVLTSSRREEYERDPGRLEQPPAVNNVFVFEKEAIRVTLYYQPVIYDQSHEEKGVTGLIRSTSLSFPRSWGESARGKFYTPDYLFKIEKTGWSGARYVLGDAKYTTSANVRDYKLIPLIYRYLFSLLCKNPNDQITGLYIFQGKSSSGTDSETLVSSAYDLCENPHSIFPAVEMISLYEYMGTRQDLQFEALDQIFSVQFQDEIEQTNQGFSPRVFHPARTEAVEPFETQ